MEVPLVVAHLHTSRSRCRDFSCLRQSYLLLNESQQNVHWKGRKLGSIFFALDAVVALFLCRLLNELLRRLPDVAELADAVECADELLHSLPRLVEESDRRSGPWFAGDAMICESVSPPAWKNPGDHAVPFGVRGDDEYFIDDFGREYTLLRLGSLERYAGLSG